MTNYKNKKKHVNKKILLNLMKILLQIINQIHFINNNYNNNKISNIYNNNNKISNI